MTHTADDFPTIQQGQSAALAEAAAISKGVWRRFRRHPGAIAGSIIFMILLLLVVLAPLSPYDPEVSNMAVRTQPPSWKHTMGTDALGRDMLTRVLYGRRISVLVGLLV